MQELQVLNDIYKTLKKSVRIDAKPIQNGSIPLWKSKFGGIPYIPKGMEYPRHSNGEPLHLLAQFNLTDIFTDAPYLELFPKSGILQFYISNKNGYGLLDGGFRVIYIPNIKSYDNQSDLGFLSMPENFPVEYPHVLTFSPSEKPIPVLNNNFKEIFFKYIDNPSSKLEFYKMYESLIDSYNPHQIGGWASFAQNAPSFIEEIDDYEVLLQIDSINYITFGNAGIATFFIKKKIYKKRIFQNQNFTGVVANYE